MKITMMPMSEDDDDDDDTDCDDDDDDNYVVAGGDADLRPRPDLQTSHIRGN